MLFTDKTTFDGLKITADGYLVANVRAARTGIQNYLGSEVGKPEMSTVRVYRPEAEVFHKDTLASFTHIPITNDHPPESVTADNWKKYGVGDTGEDVARDGETMRVSMMVKDAAAIRAVEGGKRELSCGYNCDLKWESGFTKDGQPYDAVQTNIRGNHLAIVNAARGGPTLKIGDEAMTKMIMVDGHSVEMSDAAAIAVAVLQHKLTDAEMKVATIAAKDTQIATLTATVSAKDGEIAVLKDTATKNVITPALIDAAVTARGLVIDAAKKIVPTFDATGKTDAEIRKAIVTARLGDAAATMDDAAIGGAFQALTASTVVDTVRSTYATVMPTNVVQFDASKAQATMDAAHAAMVASLTVAK